MLIVKKSNHAHQRHYGGNNQGKRHEMAYSRKTRGSTGKRTGNAGRGRVRSKVVSRKIGRSSRGGKPTRSRSGGQTIRLVIEQAPVSAPMSAQEMLTPTQQVAVKQRRF